MVATVPWIFRATFQALSSQMTLGCVLDPTPSKLHMIALHAPLALHPASCSATVNSNVHGYNRQQMHQRGVKGTNPADHTVRAGANQAPLVTRPDSIPALKPSVLVMLDTPFGRNGHRHLSNPEEHLVLLGRHKFGQNNA